MCKKQRFSTETVSRRQQSFVQYALQLAETSTCRQRHGAVVVKGGSVLSRGINKIHNCPSIFPDTEQDNPSIDRISTHAEEAALRMVSPDSARGATLYVARVLKDGTPGYSKPCPRCQSLIDSMGIKKVVYS